MKLTSYGATREVTGSKHLLEVNGKKILLDCGMFQGRRKEAAEKNHNLPIDPAGIDHIIVSHAHMDHTGSLPTYVKNGYANEIISTHATRDLSSYMLADSAYIQEREAEYLTERKREFIEPLYNMEDVTKTINNFATIGYHVRHEVTPGVWLTYYDAGHILGSAQIYLEIDDHDDDNKRKTLYFTGDLGRKGLPILRDPELIREADFIISECTYGNRFHKYIVDVDDHFERVINETVNRGGKVIIPAFALERTQEVVYHLHLLMNQKRIPEIPIFVDSPLACNVTTVFKSHPECYDKEIYEEFIKQNDNPFGFDRLKYITDVQDSKNLNNLKQPAIIISASGMMEHGRVLHHLKNNIENPANTIMVVGYQAAYTLGRQIIEGQKVVKILGKSYKNNAQVEIMDAFSGHADRSDLINHLSYFDPKPKQIFLVHGEEGQGLTFKEILEELDYTGVTVSEFGVGYDL
ncbi:MBL fold metallo-hydrolase [Candidatus Peregrinibacteria bacterium CG11_big_fil_rev_8_21_14_0_20_41_10]|nr:MAG: MBL fold metallo-hydrolase [Candidatus Peregrinibacteria bacterium CG11_big_fil_rev_8_21_14_0_20_41_10]PJC38323.1 MAG: MBL fold metallo-hydrolase [Candidatus Peregrinibacteria bacterium CG_4_9_14_0_2_um_filter_41_14]